MEDDARGYPIAEEVLNRLSYLPQVAISDYQELFSRPGMSFPVQKRAPALILAVKHGRFLYRGNDLINSWQKEEVYYNDLIRNCIYNCEYCFLQGMHASAHAVVFVNFDDYAGAARAMARERGSLSLSVSYLTDLLGFEQIVPYTREWIRFARSNPEVEIEIRTKSDNYPLLRTLPPEPNVIFVWSLAPGRIATGIERGTASFKNRLFAARSALERGFRVRLCFDPIVAVADWQEQYAGAIEETFNRLPADRIELVSVGSLRMNRDQLDRVKKSRPESASMYRELSPQASVMEYPAKLRNEIEQFVGTALSRFVSEDRILFI